MNYLGFEVPDEFVVGYGLDFAGAYRNLPDIHSLHSEASHERCTISSPLLPPALVLLPADRRRWV